MKKVEFPVNKHNWNPSIIPGPIFIVSTYDKDGTPNLAPKSWVQMVSFEPSILMFSGSKGNTTENNILDTKCFALNLVTPTIIDQTVKMIEWFGEERIKKSGFTLEKANMINAPLISESCAHLECQLIETKEIGSGYVIFGEIVNASIWEKLLRSENKYADLNQALFLDSKVYSTTGNIFYYGQKTHENEKD